MCRDSGCTHALFTVNETKRESKVYCSFLDASKAFANNLHNGILKKLIDRGIPVSVDQLLRYWYSNLQCTVKWHQNMNCAAIAVIRHEFCCACAVEVNKFSKLKLA